MRAPPGRILSSSPTASSSDSASSLPPHRNAKGAARARSRPKRTKIGPHHATYALALREMGRSVREIARELGIGVATVHRLQQSPRGVDGLLLVRLLDELRTKQALQCVGASLAMLDENRGA